MGFLNSNPGLTRSHGEAALSPTGPTRLARAHPPLSGLRPDTWSKTLALESSEARWAKRQEDGDKLKLEEGQC